MEGNKFQQTCSEALSSHDGANALHDRIVCGMFCYRPEVHYLHRHPPSRLGLVTLHDDTHLAKPIAWFFTNSDFMYTCDWPICAKHIAKKKYCWDRRQNHALSAKKFTEFFMVCWPGCLQPFVGGSEVCNSQDKFSWHWQHRYRRVYSPLTCQ